MNGSATRDESLQEQAGRLGGTDLFMICAVAISRKHKGNIQVEIQRDRSCQFRNLPLHGLGFLSLPVSLMERHRGQRLLRPNCLAQSEGGGEALGPKGERRSFDMNSPPELAPRLLPA